MNLKDKLKVSFYKNFFSQVKSESKIFFNIVEDEKEGIQDKDIIYLNDSFENHYEIKEFLGEGTSSIVKKVREKKTNKIFAAKIFKTRSKEILQDLKKEFLKMKSLKHPNIINFYKLLINSKTGKIYLILEYFSGQKLTNFSKYQSEAKKKKIFKQLIIGILYLHSHGVIHRDLKPENILIKKSKENDFKLKIIDFNVSKIISHFSHYNYLSKKNYKIGSVTGTIDYSAPEMLKNSLYSEMVDVWSAGCCLYFLICGKKLFREKKVSFFMNEIFQDEIFFDEESFFSFEVRDLIRKMVCVDYKKRIVCSDVIFHPWFKKREVVFENRSRNLSDFVVRNRKCGFGKKNTNTIF